jgi:pyrimidine-nucleoside phosphorylase
MACFLHPLSKKETAMLTKAMAYSGNRLKFDNIKMPTVDKHSTGGVGDGISLALAPLAACAGVAVPMMSGRGLGHTGGTLDKLESMKGFEVRVKTPNIYKQMKALGVCMFGQTKDLAPADKKLYSLRDASGTVESRPLITASILSKKYAEGVKSLFIDVKYGSGAFMQNYKDAKELAKTLVETAKMLGLKCCALLTDMDTPLGRAVGNANEMRQSIAVLKGDKNIAPDFYELLVESAAYMLFISGKEKNIAKARAVIEKKLAGGEALKKFKEMLKWQGANPDIAEHPEKYLKDSKNCALIKADKAGYITR